METTKYLLKDLLTIKNGKDHKALADGPYPVFGTGGLMRYAEKFLYDKVSILLPRKGTLDNIQYVDEPFWTVDTIYYTVVNEELADPYYLYCYINSLDLSGYDSGASIPSMTQKAYNKIKINLPNKETQVLLGKAIKTYDELIENNNKRIKLLEQMAENLYQEWFVRFRFPGYETAEFENGIPKGWGYMKFEDILSFDRGISYSSEEIDCEDGLNLINLKNIDAFGGFRRDGTKKYNGKYKETQVVKKGDLVIGVTDMTQDRRTVGAAALIPTIEGVSVISADLVKVVSDIPNIYLYCLCRYGFYSKYFSQFANGANVLHLKPGALLNKKVLLPTKGLIESFVEKASMIIELTNELNLANDNLIKQRNLLLPRLMSGKLEI